MSQHLARSGRKQRAAFLAQSARHRPLNCAPSTLDAPLSNVQRGRSPASPTNAMCRQSAKSPALLRYSCNATSRARSDSNQSSAAENKPWDQVYQSMRLCRQSALEAEDTTGDAVVDSFTPAA